jgi:tetratricopeptide (TPR) repeat protein
MPLNTKQIAVITGGIALSVLLYFAPRKLGVTEKSSEVKTSQRIVANESEVSLWIDSLEEKLSSDEKIMMEKLKKLKSNRSDSLMVFWVMLNQPIPAAFYADQSAKENPSVEKLIMAGNRCYLATRYSNNNLSGIFFEKAIMNFQSALEKDSSNLTAKTSLGACYVEGTQEPMKGIALLREVVAKDSTFIEAHLRLAMFAVQSGQFEKAIERYKKILEINPSFIEAHLYMGEVYASMNQKEKAINSLLKFKELSNDALVDSEIDKYIKQLKNS